MQSKIRILFSIEAADRWIFQAYKQFFDLLDQNTCYEMFCTVYGVKERKELLGEYNVIDYEKISHDGVNLLTDGLFLSTCEELSRQAHKSSLWNPPEQILKRLSLFKVVLSLLQPDIVIAWNGMADIRRMVRQLLSELGIPFFYAEKGMLPDSWYIDEQGINARCSLDSSSFEQTIDSEEGTRIEDYIKDIVKSGSSAWEQPSRIAGEHTLKEKLGIDPDLNLIFFPGQVDEDVNITTFSPFKNVAEAVRLVAESMPAKTVLVVKPHPKAKENSQKQLSELTEKYKNLVVVKDANVWDLIEISDLVISINSTVAFESLLKKKKVVLLGRSVLSKTSLLEKVDRADLKRQMQDYLSASFESLIDYSRVLSFVKFLKDDYYIFRDSAHLPAGIEQKLAHRAKSVSPKIFTRDVLMSMFYKGISQQRFLNNPAHTVKAESTTSKQSTPKLSVILTTYNRPKLLEKTLVGFANQTASKEDFEIIVVDDGSQPPVKRIAEEFCDRINVVYLRQENKGLAAARNTGIKAAKGQIVLFSDDDDVPAPDLIAEHLRSHQEHPDERIAVLGHLDWHSDLQVTPLMHYITHVGGEYFGYDKLQDGQFYNVWKWWGGLISAKRSLLKSVEGPFDSRLRFGYEDTELVCRLWDKDIKILYNAQAKSFILRPVDFEGFCRRRYMQGQALYRVASAHPEIIIPRYGLQDAAHLYHSRYARSLQEWADKVIKFEPVLNERVKRQDPEYDKLMQSVYTLYRECFIGYWLKGYVEQMQAVEGGAVSLSEPVNSEAECNPVLTEAADKSASSHTNLEPDCNQPIVYPTTAPLRIAFVSSFVPVFDRGSSDVRNYQILKILTASGVKVDYLYSARTKDDSRYKAAFDGAVTFIEIPQTVNGFGDYLHFNNVKKLDYVWITNLWMVPFFDFAVRLTQWLKHNRPQTKVIIDTMDFHYKKFKRKFDISHDSQDLVQAEQFLEAEKKLYPLADMVLTVTDVEKRDIIQNVGSHCNISVVPNIHKVFTQEPEFEQRRHICFLGSFGINHNADAVIWFLREVFPLIVAEAPEIEFHILGFNNEKFRDKLQQNPNVKVIGYVEDAESAVANYRLFVCPMRYGAGMKGKLGTAAATGTPIVTTTVGAEGFDFVDGQNCFIADRPEDFARKCLHLLSDAPLWKQFSRKAKEMVGRKFSIKAASERICALLQPTTALEGADKVPARAVAEPVPPIYSVPADARVSPKVSIITSCHNCETFLAECLDSIRNQTMHQWELFLLDDGSTDGTRAIIEEYCRMDDRIRPYYFQSNEGPYVRRNFAIQRANSDFIVIQDADDIMSPVKLEILYNEITKDRQLAVVGSFYRIFLEEFKGPVHTDCIALPTTHDEIMEQYFSALYICWHGSAIIRKSLFETIGLYDNNPFGSDTLLLAKAAEYAMHSREIRFKNIPTYLTIKRERASSQQGTLPPVNPKSRRARFRIYWLHKLLKIKEKLQKNPALDIKIELRNCKCDAFMERYGSFFEHWESEPLGSNVISRLLNTAMIFFNNRRYVTSITTLNGIEVSLSDIAKRFKNFDLLRAIAFLAIDMRKQSLMYLNREIQNHKNPAAEQFISDYFEGPHFAKRSQNGNPEKQSRTDVQKWCAEHSDLYDLQMIDTQAVAQNV